MISILFNILIIFLGDPLIIVTGLVVGLMSNTKKKLLLIAIPTAGLVVAVILTMFLQDRAINQQIPGGPELVFLRFVAFAIYAGIGFGLRHIFTVWKQKNREG